MGQGTTGAARGALLLAFAASAACARSTAPPRQIRLDYEGPIQSRDVVEGGRIYLTLCAACHRGRVNPKGYAWSPGQMRHQIREGNRLMPPLSAEFLSDGQVEAVLAYLAVLGALDGSLPPPTDGVGPNEDEMFAEDYQDESYEQGPEPEHALPSDVGVDSAAEPTPEPAAVVAVETPATPEPIASPPEPAQEISEPPATPPSQAPPLRGAAADAPPESGDALDPAPPTP